MKKFNIFISFVVSLTVLISNSPVSFAAVQDDKISGMKLNEVSDVCSDVFSVFAACDDTDTDASDESAILRNNPLANDYMVNEGETRIRNGWWWTSNELTYSFGYGITSAMQEKIEDALDTWSDVSLYGYDVEFTFTEVDSGADIRFNAMANTRALLRLATTTPYDVNGHPEGEEDCVRGAINYVSIVFYTPTDGEYSFTNTSDPENYNFESVAVHEIGHALGIAHCHTACTSSCTSNVMSSYLGKGQVRRTLQEYDKASLIALYCIYQPFA